MLFRCFVRQQRFVDVSTWQPSQEEWAFALAQVRMQWVTRAVSRNNCASCSVRLAEASCGANAALVFMFFLRCLTTTTTTTTNGYDYNDLALTRSDNGWPAAARSQRARGMHQVRV